MTLVGERYGEKILCLRANTIWEEIQPRLDEPQVK